MNSVFYHVKKNKCNPVITCSFLCVRMKMIKTPTICFLWDCSFKKRGTVFALIMCV